MLNSSMILNFRPIFLLALLVFVSCNENSNNQKPISSGNTGESYLYVATGACYSGAGNTTFSNLTSSNLIYRLNLSTGSKDLAISDYYPFPSVIGDSPVSIYNADNNYFYALVENPTSTAARRVEKIEKKNNGLRTTYITNLTALSGILRDFYIFEGNNFLISKTTAIELLTSSGSRITKGANPYVNAPAAPCATSTTLINSITSLSNDFIAFAHAGAGQSRIAFNKPTGYALAGDCTLAQATPNAAAYPTSMIYDSENTTLIVAYAGNAVTTDINSIYAYKLTEDASSVTISSAHKIYDSSLYPVTYSYLLYGISAMTYDATNKTIYIGSAATTATTVVNYIITKLNYDSTLLGVDDTKVLSVASPNPFYKYGSDTKCISDLMIAN